MNIELEKYRADIFKIAGFAVMTPLGRIFVEPVAVFREFGIIGSITYSIFSILLSLLGLIFFAKGYDILNFEIRKK